MEALIVVAVIALISCYIFILELLTIRRLRKQIDIINRELGNKPSDLYVFESTRTYHPASILKTDRKRVRS